MTICLASCEIRDLTGERLPSDQTRVLAELDIRFAVRPNGFVVVMRKTVAERNQRLRQQWRKYWKEYDADHDRYAEELEAWENLGPEIRLITPEPEPPVALEFPEELRNMTCGAKTRRGTFCKRRDLYASGRCRMHGGPSTGPTSEAGKQRSALNGLCPKGTDAKARTASTPSKRRYVLNTPRGMPNK
jgi:hypothetical protein